MLRLITVGVACWIMSASVSAEELDLRTLVSDAFAQLESDVQSRWQFVEVSDDGEFKRRASYSPIAPEGEQWQLLSVNEQAASIEDVAAFRQQKREQQEREAKRNSGAEADPLDSIDMTSLKLLEEDETGWRIGFTPIGAGEGRKMMSKMLGTLRISKPVMCVEYLEIASPGPVKPQLGVKVEHFLSRFEFAPIEQSVQRDNSCGRLLPMTMKFEINMRAFGVMAVDRAMSAQYSDYRSVETF